MLTILITPRRPLTSAHPYQGELHISHESAEQIFARLSTDAVNALPPDSFDRCVKASVASTAEANRFVQDYVKTHWICWCDDPRSYVEI